MNLGVSFAPLVPAYVVWAAFGVALLISIVLLLARSRGAPMRALALGLMVLALANPSLTREDRDPIPSVAAVIVDKSPSQNFGDRGDRIAVFSRQGWIGERQHHHSERQRPHRRAAAARQQQHD